MQQATIPASQVTDTQRLASAIVQIALGLQARGVEHQGIRDARELVRDLAFPPSPAPAPSCDAPHCACVDGTDCHANAAAEKMPWNAAARTARSLADRLRASHMPLWTLSWQGDRFQIQDGVVTATTYELAPNATIHESVVAINSLVRSMRLNMIAMESVVAFRDDGNGKVTPIYGPPPVDAPPAPDLAARLDGLKASLDALAERLDRKAGVMRGYSMTGATVIDVTVISTHTISGLGTLWVIEHDYGIQPGSLVRSVGNPGSEGDSVMRVARIDVTNPLGKRMSIIVRPAKEG